MSTERCKHEFIVGECDLCTPQTKVEVPESDKPNLGPIVIAEHNGVCGVCEEKIIANVDHIGRVEDAMNLLVSVGEWVHYGCGR